MFCYAAISAMIWTRKERSNGLCCRSLTVTRHRLLQAPVHGSLKNRAAVWLRSIVGPGSTGRRGACLAARRPDRHHRAGVTHAPHPPDARTNPVAHAEIARSDEPGSVLAKRCGVSTGAACR